MYKIYVHIFPDGRKYVGSTKQQNPKRRWKGGSSYRRQKVFYNAINSVGWDNIQHEIIDTATSKETALKLEEYYTLLWRTNEPEFGFNVDVGQKHNTEIKIKIGTTVKLTKNNIKMGRQKGYHHSEETKLKISTANKGMKMPEFSKEHREKIGAAHKGVEPANKGTYLVMVNGKRTYVKKPQ